MRRILTTIMLLCGVLLSSVAYGDDIKRHSDIPKEVYYDFIKSENPSITDKKTREIFSAVEYYTPRYFGEHGDVVFEEGLRWTLASIAQESNFENKNGDEGLSIGFMMVQYATCDVARKYNEIQREMNLIALWDNIHCGMAEKNRLHEMFEGDWEKVIKAYNGGPGVITQPNRFRKGVRMTNVHFKRVKKKREKLQRIIDEYEKNLTYGMEM